MFGEIVKLLVKAYGALLMAAAGGLVAANLSGLIGAFFVPEHKAESIGPWVHWGWIAGAAIALFGALTGRLRVISSSFAGLNARRSAGRRTSSERPLSGNRSGTTPKLRLPRGRRVGVLCSAGVFGFTGAIVGAAFGGSLLLLWFSFVYSPFSPDGWASSVRVEEIRAVDPPRNVPVPATSHPVALYAFFGPVISGAAAGVLAGGVAAAAGKVTEG